jgi:hypothetical protein
MSTSPSERPQNHIPSPVPPSTNPPVARGPRLMVIRERLDDLDALATAAAAQTSSIEPSTSVIGLEVDPTTAVDVEYPEQRPSVQLQSPVETEQDAWKKELLQQAVGLSLASPRPSTSKPASPQPHPPTKLAASPPLVRTPLPATTPTIAQQIAPPSLASSSVRPPTSFTDHHRGRQMNPNANSPALSPPPRPSRDPTNKLRKASPSRTIAPERSPPLPVPEPLPIWPLAVAQLVPALNVETASFATSVPPNARPSHREHSRCSLDTNLQVDASTSELSPVSGMGGGMGRKVSWEGGIHGALSPPPPRLSVATERGRWTPALSGDHDDDRLSMAGSATARPSMTESFPSLPRPSLSSRASQASFQSATFGPRATSKSKLGLFARARSTSPSRSSVSSKQSRSRSRAGRGQVDDRLSTRSSGHYSETDANPMVVYVQPHTRAISSTAVSGSTPTTIFVADDSMPVPPLSLPATLDRKRGITNAPTFETAHPNGSGIFGGFKRDRSPAPSMRSAILPSNTGEKPWDSLSSLTVRPVQSDHGHGAKVVQPQPQRLEQWREAQVAQEETRRFEGMLAQHIEDEKDRIRKIAFGVHSRRGSATSTTSSPA